MRKVRKMHLVFERKCAYMLLIEETQQRATQAINKTQPRTKNFLQKKY